MLHAHVLNDRRAAVLAAFNVGSDRIELEQVLDLELLGLPPTAVLHGPGVSREGEEWVVRCALDGLSARIVELGWSEQ
jgi:hypothetical protein